MTEQLQEYKINALIDYRATKKAEMDKVLAAKQELQKEIDNADRLLLRKMDSEDITRTANSNASVSINETTQPEVTDWDAFYRFLADTKQFELLQRRVSSTAYKELLGLGHSVPGLAPRTVRRINFRKL